MKIRTALTMSILLLMLGCSKLTLENYSKIDTGMTFEEVTALIGSPERCDDVLGIRNCEWGNEKRSVKVSFVGGKVILFTSSNLK
ncbi:MAG: hypothetical protein ROZ09_13195 [Thiobacillus sp.]|jgi:hypothetical protein|uniref:hypothetical protein n=1 Tax=Thiobacillus sp. TaxID=924 RepID=UPI0028950847|nr:hypothetical protein [Thiobacillus sp.]MDT3707772.1 hypothetical protein [Thiobacillus sp.]